MPVFSASSSKFSSSMDLSNRMTGLFGICSPEKQGKDLPEEGSERAKGKKTPL
ncbi:hypothetical protein [Veillonella magna]|uniref:hypothetical protein n=1 Tax=Veillonella magna TaxID=464322 RepID=UPI0026DBFC4B|nr:hypothetical protein [Veillonella magna]